MGSLYGDQYKVLDSFSYESETGREVLKDEVRAEPQYRCDIM